MVFNIINASRFLAPLLAVLWCSNAISQSSDNFDINVQNGRSDERVDIRDNLGIEFIDPYQGGLTLEYVDGIIMGKGGFNLPITRRYKSESMANFESILGVGWHLHFGRITGIAPRLNGDQAQPISSDALFCIRPTQTDPTKPAASTAPVFEDIQGKSHRLYATNQLSSSAGDMTTEDNHRVNCNDDGTIEITDSTGITYTFGKQNYDATSDEPSLVRNQSTIYVTKITDRNNNEFDFEYSRENLTTFSLENIRQGSIVATFNYNGNLLRNYGVNVLEGISYNRGQRSISYTHEASDASPRYPVRPMILTRATSPGSEGFSWNYTYQEADDSKTLRDPYGLDIETVKNKFGGTTTYGFEKIEKVGSPVELYAVTSKKQSNGGEWTYEYDVGTGSNDFDINTIEFPDGRIEEHIFCNQRQLTSVSGCQYLNGYLVEKNIYSAGTDISNGSPVQTEYYDWIFNVEFTNQYQTIPGSGGGATLSSTPHPIRSRVLAQRIIHRDNNYYTTSYFDFDFYGNPADIVEKNNNSRKSYPASASSITGVRKHTEYTYDNKTSNSNWVLGLVKSQTLNEVNDIPTDDKIVNTYWPSGDLKTSNVNGKLSSYDYNNGNLTSITLPDGHQIKYSQFVLGIPELIQQSRYQVGNFELVESRDIDSRTGYINSVSDESIDVLENDGGGTTKYEYDKSGRVNKVTTPRLGSSAISIDRGTSSTKTIRGNRQVE